ncbi:hypothetical protein K469DRAFT_590445, partial [Zopfia rhizophila CBS 207.26]
SGPSPPQMESALLECFLSATRLLPLRLRSSFILIGRAASVFNGFKRYTEDVDVAATSEAILYFHGAIASGTTQFKCGDPSQTIEFHCSQDFIVHLELLRIGGGFVDSIAAYEPFRDGFIASRVGFLALRGVTVADRGEDGDLLDFKFLLRTTAGRGSILPRLDWRTAEALKKVAGKLSWVDALVLSGILREDNFILFESL